MEQVLSSFLCSFLLLSLLLCKIFSCSSSPSTTKYCLSIASSNLSSGIIKQEAMKLLKSLKLLNFLERLSIYFRQPSQDQSQPRLLFTVNLVIRQPKPKDSRRFQHVSSGPTRNHKAQYQQLSGPQ